MVLRFFFCYVLMYKSDFICGTTNVNMNSLKQEHDKKDSEAAKVRQTMREKAMVNNAGTSRRPQPKKTAGN